MVGNRITGKVKDWISDGWGEQFGNAKNEVEGYSQGEKLAGYNKLQNVTRQKRKKKKSHGTYCEIVQISLICKLLWGVDAAGYIS
jgi:hypothetical protein